MRYLSIDIEATGLKEDDAIIEFAMIPFDTGQGLAESMACHFFVACEPFEQLKPRLDQWVIDNNRKLIEQAHAEGLEQKEFKRTMEEYLASKEVREYFDTKKNKITLFGKSMASIDLPFLKRDLGWDWMNQHFCHRQLDLSSVAYHLVDQGRLPAECVLGSKLMNHLGMGEVCHTALEDARHSALMYLELLRRLR